MATTLEKLFVIGCLMAGVYGALHNQMSYTASPEYLTQFKFHQFHIRLGIPERVGATIVGWKASWWMGIVIGQVLVPYGIPIRDAAS